MMSDFQINTDDMVGEWTSQPRLVYKYNMKLSAAKKAVEELENNLAVVKAKKEKEIRNNPEKYGLIKTTDAAVSTAVTCDAEVVETRKEVTEARYKESVLWAACRALENKKTALENIVRMQGREMFSEPKAPGAREFVEKETHRFASSKLRRNLNQDEEE